MSGSASHELTPRQREIHAFIVDEIVTDQPAESITADEDLIKRGIVDSLAVTQLVDFVESRYGIQVADPDLVPENFRSLRQLADYVDRKQAPVG
ncbi:MAG: acyl carrier protein [Myxococcales bacterium]|jgi:acyl carrier protein